MSTAVATPPETTLPAGVTSATKAENVSPPIAPVDRAETAAPSAAKPAAEKLNSVESKAAEQKSAGQDAKDKPTAGPGSLLGDVAAPDDKPAAVEDGKPSEILYALKAPEKSTITADDLKDIEAFAKANKISPEAAQALVDRQAKTIGAQTEVAQAKLATITDEWKKQAVSDKSLGGANWKRTVQLVDRALVDEPELRDVLANAPFRFHPAIIRYLAKQGAKTVEDTRPAASAAPVNDPRTQPPQQRWYPHLYASRT